MLFDVLTLPILGVPRMICWIGERLIEAAEQEELDEGKLQGQLLELQMSYELGEIDADAYEAQETAILERLSIIRQIKELD